MNIFLTALGRSSLQASVLVLAVLLTQWLFRKQLSPRWRCALWLLVVGRLLLPISIGSVASIFNLLPRWSERVESAAKPPAATQVLVPQPVTAEGVTTPVAGPREKAASDGVPPVTADLTPPSPHQEPSVPAHSALPAAPKQPGRFPWVALLFWSWVAGVAGLSAHLLKSCARLARRLTQLERTPDPALLTILDECRSLLAVRAPLRVMENEALSMPALYGLFRPCLLLPHGLAGKFSPRELRFIFLHELAHLKRRDLPLNWLMTLLQVAHWFNPLIWLAFARWRADRELACDALTLEAAGSAESKEYGRTILRLVEGFVPSATVPGLVGILEDKRQLKRRIRMIAQYSGSKRWPVLSLLAGLALAVTGLTDAQSNRSVGSGRAKASDERNPRPPSQRSSALEPRLVVTNGAVMKILVQDAATGLPLPNTEVLAPHQAAFFGGKDNAPLWTTDKDGVALIRLGDVPDNHLQEKSWFTISVKRRGYAPRGFSWAAQNKDARPGMPKELVVQLERGLTVGGIAVDEKGAPIAGLRVRVVGAGYWQIHSSNEEFRFQQYPEFWTEEIEPKAVLTDTAGHWQIEDFPQDLEDVTVEFVWPEGPSERFRKRADEWAMDPRNRGEPLNLDDFRAQKEKFVLKTGFKARGVVLDPDGKPMPGVLLKVGSGLHNQRENRELRTDGSGHFDLQHLLHRQIFITAYPDSFAITSTIIDLATNTAEIRLQAAARRPLQIRVVDGEGVPIKEAKVFLDGYRTEGQALDFKGVTDQNGLLVWTNAPLSSFGLVAGLPSGQDRQKIRVVPEQRDLVFRLRDGLAKKVIVTGKVRDALSGAPVKLESVAYQTADQEGFVFEGEPNETGFRLTVPATRFRPGGMYAQFQLQLRAKGYSLMVTPWRDFDEGDWDEDFALQPASESGRTILLPNDKPGADTRVWLQAERNFMPLGIHGPNLYYGDRMIKLRADVGGKFALPTVPSPSAGAIILTDPGGFLATTVASLQQSKTAQLQPWGTIEGTLKVGGHANVKTQVDLSPLLSVSLNGFYVSYRTTTSKDGTFIFTNVPPGEYKVYRVLTPHRSITQDHQLPVSIKPGQTANLEWGGDGRKLIGQATPDKPGVSVDWLNDDHTLSLKQPALPPFPDTQDFATTRAFEQARDAYYVSEENKRFARAARTYVLQFDADGSFYIDDVPPGSYELAIHVNKNGNRSDPSPFALPKGNVGNLVRDVVVPAGDGPFDLGQLVVPITDEDVKPPSVPALQLEAETLDGKPFDLTQFKGQHVLLAFWAPWSERSLEQLSSLQKLRREWGPDAAITIVGVSVDGDAPATRRAVESGGYKGPQVRLTEERRAKVTAAWDVNNLPTVVLLNPDGRIAARDLEGERLRTAVRRALAKK